MYGKESEQEVRARLDLCLKCGEPMPRPRTTNISRSFCPACEKPEAADMSRSDGLGADTPTNADEPATILDLLRVAMSDDEAAVAIWRDHDDEPTGGIVVGLTDSLVRVENGQTRTIEEIALSDITEVEIERP